MPFRDSTIFPTDWLPHFKMQSPTVWNLQHSMKKERDQKHSHKRKIPNHSQNDLCNNQANLRNVRSVTYSMFGKPINLWDNEWLHREALRAGKPRRIYYHFNRADHTETDMKVTPIEMVPTEVDILAWEQEWINRLRTRKPDRLNFHWPPDTRTYVIHIYNQQQRIHHDADIETRRRGTSQQDRQQDEQCSRLHHKFCK